MTRSTLIGGLIGGFEQTLPILHSTASTPRQLRIFFSLRYKTKAKMDNHPLGFHSVANRPSGVLILQNNHLEFLNW